MISSFFKRNSYLGRKGGRREEGSELWKTLYSKSSFTCCVEIGDQLFKKNGHIAGNLMHGSISWHVQLIRLVQLLAKLLKRNLNITIYSRYILILICQVFASIGKGTNL